MEEVLLADLANGAVIELLLQTSSQLNSFRLESDTRLAELETRDAVTVARPDVQVMSSQQTVSIQPGIIIAPSTPQSNFIVSSTSIRMLERDMPILPDENFPDWLDHAIAYGHASG